MLSYRNRMERAQRMRVTPTDGDVPANMYHRTPAKDGGERRQGCRNRKKL